jgi:hypothetical protein
LVGGQVPPNPQVFNQGLVDGPQDYTIDRKGDFIMKLVGAACILTVLLPRKSIESETLLLKTDNETDMQLFSDYRSAFGGVRCRL